MTPKGPRPATGECGASPEAVSPHALLPLTPENGVPGGWEAQGRLEVQGRCRDEKELWRGSSNLLKTSASLKQPVLHRRDRSRRSPQED